MYKIATFYKNQGFAKSSPVLFLRRSYVTGPSFDNQAPPKMHHYNANNSIKPKYYPKPSWTYSNGYSSYDFWYLVWYESPFFWLKKNFGPSFDNCR